MAELYVVGAELLRCTIEGKPVSKGRPRCACRGGYPIAHTSRDRYIHDTCTGDI